MERLKKPLEKSEKFPSLSKLPLLVKLDEDYSDIISKASTFVCPRFGRADDSVSPTMCMICGEMLCSQVTFRVVSEGGGGHPEIFLLITGENSGWVSEDKIFV